MEKQNNKMDDAGFCESVFSWSIQDIFNEQLHVNKVKRIPNEFDSVADYFGAYKYPLLEEIRTGFHSSLKVISTAPYAEVIAFEEAKPRGSLHYNIRVDYWRNETGHGNEPFKMLPGQVFILANHKPETATGMDLLGKSWAYAMVVSMKDRGYEEDGSFYAIFRVRVSKDVKFSGDIWGSMFIVFLTNVTVEKRIWCALRRFRNLQVVERLLSSETLETMKCSFRGCNEAGLTSQYPILLSSHLNDSQSEAVLSCLHKIKCSHQPSVELIWGPPGTGKTNTVTTLLATLLGMGCRILTCAPTNVAITALARGTLDIIRRSVDINCGTELVIYSLGHMLLFGNHDRLKVGCDIEEDIYLEYRVERLAMCFRLSSGWRHCFNTMIHLLENCVFLYDDYFEKIKEHKLKDKKDLPRVVSKSFTDFAMESFKSSAAQLEECIYTMCTHIPKNFLGKENFQNMVSVLELLHCLEASLLCVSLIPCCLKDLFLKVHPSCWQGNTMVSLFTSQRLKCISDLKELESSLNKLDFPSTNSISDFCFKNASIVFCTVAGSFKLHLVKMEPMDVLVIDEAAQLKECEAVIPLQLPCIRHAILVGDDRQLPATVLSNISNEAGFGKSMFERLITLGCPKHLLNIQYRMHPGISCFPNSKFYSGSIIDAPIVRSKEYQKCYIPGKMYGSYSFINIIGGREEFDDCKRSRRNSVEAATVAMIICNLHKAWSSLKGTLSIGVISPYTAQVLAIEERLAHKYENIDGFEVKVSSIDGFQGSEKDIVILSTVRSHSVGSVGFISSVRRANVALTRARHSLWILGNEQTLSNSVSVWAEIIRDAKNRNCFFNADENQDLAKAIVEVKKELNQYDDLLNTNSVLFRSARWRVLFTYDFKKSFRSISSDQTKNSVVNLLLKLSDGWRPKKMNIGLKCQTSSRSLKQFKVERFFVLCSVEIIKESGYVQVLKFWNILPLEEIPKQVKCLEGIFSRYTEDYINHSKAQCLEGDLEIPRTWSASLNLIQFKSANELGTELGGTSNDQDHIQNPEVSESLLLMKYYSISSDSLNTLLSGDCRELGLPYTLTEEEREILLFDKSTFVLGRSGTGKTTILTMKMFRREYQHYLVTQQIYATNGNVTPAITDDNQPPVLRQLFVTASPKLCVAVKQHISHFESFACNGQFIAGRQYEYTATDYADDTSIFKLISDSFTGIPSTAYPLVITFQKLFLMLDGTVGNSYFERFPILRKLSNARSNVLQNFIKMNQVTYDLFCFAYWPHFNSQLTKKLDSLRVYIEIMSHIKGDLQARNRKLSLEQYLQLTESRTSAVGKNEREMIFDIFLDYEKMKVENSHFDLADLVNDLHRRFKSEKYQGDQMDFVYIDEVQDLTMRQLSLLKYICKNVEGYVFSGDTAQTSAKGVDFRFSDVRSLFYDEFFNSSKSDAVRNKGRVSEIFHLSQNFRMHAEIVKLAQSVIDIVFRYFPKTIDVLSPESSMIHGSPPVLLESGQNENPLKTIFGNSGNASGLGAEQVIIVRDEYVRQEISKYVKKQAIVMTIVESKGMAFQDVLLYNFFSSSPLKTQWGVVYEYMREHNLLEATSQLTFPSFNEAKHSLMCSELKQLYVAITRAKHRLWISENREDFPKPMFDYWKKLGSVQVRVLNHSLAKEMQASSTPEEWKSRGFELLNENNFELATMCFTKSGDHNWLNFAKASGLRAAADQIQITSPVMGRRLLSQAAELYHAIGNTDKAAECYLDLENYDKLRKHFKQLKL